MTGTCHLLDCRLATLKLRKGGDRMVWFRYAAAALWIVSAGLATAQTTAQTPPSPAVRGLGIFNGNFAATVGTGTDNHVLTRLPGGADTKASIPGWSGNSINNGTIDRVIQGIRFDGCDASGEIIYPDGPGSYAINVRSNDAGTPDSVGVLTSDPFIPNAPTLTFMVWSESSRVAAEILLLDAAADVANPAPGDILLQVPVVNHHPGCVANAVFERQSIDISQFYNAANPGLGRPIRVQVEQHTTENAFGWASLFTDFDAGPVRPLPPALSISEQPVPASNAQPTELTAGPDGNVWFTEWAGGKVGRITGSGQITEFPLPTANSHPHGICAGGDGNLWFVETSAGQIARITPAGSVTEFPLPNPKSSPFDIVWGPDDNLWFVEETTNTIAKMTVEGAVSEYPVPTGDALPTSIASGQDGNLWFTELQGNKIGKITTSGSITEYGLPHPGSQPYVITSGGDGNIWFTEPQGNRIGRMAINGSLVEFPVPSTGSGANGISRGPDGNIWFTERDTSSIGRVSSDGEIAEYRTPTPDAGPAGIVAGPDGRIWFAEFSGNKIGSITLPIPTIAPYVDVVHPSQTYTFALAINAPNASLIKGSLDFAGPPGATASFEAEADGFPLITSLAPPTIAGPMTESQVQILVPEPFVNYPITVNGTIQVPDTAITENTITITWPLLAAFNGSGQPTGIQAQQLHLSVAPLPGDVNLDGQVTVADATLLLRWILGLTDLTPQQLAAADVNGAAGVKLADVTLILRKAIGLITAFPTGSPGWPRGA